MKKNELIKLRERLLNAYRSVPYKRDQKSFEAHMSSVLVDMIIFVSNQLQMAVEKEMENKDLSK